MGDAAGVAPGCVLVRTACHSAALLFCSARTSSLESLTTCSIVAVRHGPSAALAMTADAVIGSLSKTAIYAVQSEEEFKVGGFIYIVILVMVRQLER